MKGQNLLESQLTALIYYKTECNKNTDQHQPKDPIPKNKEKEKEKEKERKFKKEPYDGTQCAEKSTGSW